MRVTAAKAALAALAVAFVVTHVIAVYTESINWDEFVLLQRAEITVATGELQGGGRPGLGTLALVPFAHDCTSSIDATHAARLAWCAITFAILGGLFVLLLRATRSWHAAALGVGLLALVPVFVQWSVHVRTDQPAIASVLWGGVALFASARRVWWAILAGALFLIGFYFSQKAVYLVALVLVVVAGEAFVAGRIAWRREAMRAACVLAGAALAVAIYKLVIPQFYTPPVTVSVEGGMNLFAFYRQALGYRVYAQMLPTLIPHLVLLGLLVVATIVAMRRGSEHRRPLLVALAVAALGLVVGKFHAAAFPYFWMTLGCFFATAIALGWAGICDLYPRARVPLAALAWIALVVNGVRSTASVLEDSQQIQRATIAFVERNFEPARRSYDTHGVLFCRSDPDPMPGALVSSLMARFRNKQYTETFLRQFRERPIAILFLPNQIGSYPAEVHALWDAHYVPYWGPIRIAGRMVQGKAGDKLEVDILVPARYRWRTRDGAAMRITVGGKPVAPTVHLAGGRHTIELLDDADGMLVLDVDDPPWLGDTPFYSARWVQRWHEARDAKKPLPVYR